MSTLNKWFCAWLLTGVLKQVANSILSHKYVYTMSPIVYKNLDSLDNAGRTCDFSITSSKHCDVIIAIEANCIDCYHNAPTFYPASGSYFVDAYQVGKTTLDGYEKLTVIFDTSVTAVFIRFTVIDSDWFFDDTIQTGEISFKKHFVYKRTPIMEHKLSNNSYISLREHLDCAKPACGEKCVVPNEYVDCRNDKPVCTNGKFFEECELFAGNFAWHIKMQSLERKNNNLRTDCYEMLSVCMELNDISTCDPQPLKGTEMIKFSKFARKSNDLSYLVSRSCSSASEGGAETVLLGQEKEFLLETTHWRYNITITSGCQPKYTGKLCSTYCQNCK